MPRFSVMRDKLCLNSGAGYAQQQERRERRFHRNFNRWIEATAAIDATYVKADRSAHGGKGGRRRRPSVFRAAVRTTKIHVLTDVLGRPAVIRLTLPTI